jgi:hypothetical protein
MHKVAEIARHRLEALAAALSCWDFRLQIGCVAAILGLSEQHTQLQLRRLRELDERLGYRAWALTDSRWFGLRPSSCSLAAARVLRGSWSRPSSRATFPGGSASPGSLFPSTCACWASYTGAPSS